MTSIGEFGPWELCLKSIDGDLAEENLRKNPMAGGQHVAERTESSWKIGSLLRLWKLATN